MHAAERRCRHAGAGASSRASTGSAAVDKVATRKRAALLAQGWRREKTPAAGGGDQGAMRARSRGDLARAGAARGPGWGTAIGGRRALSTLWPDSDAYKTVSGEGKGWLTVGRVAVRVVTLFEIG